MIENCVECNQCVKECEFLKRYGNPVEVSKKIEKNILIAFECSLCGLCEAVCKKDVKFVDFILSKREEAAKKGLAPLKEHKRVLNFEKNASSSMLKIYKFSNNSDKIFFPGCAFTGNDPEFVLNVYKKLCEILNEKVSIGIDCCFKISHDLGLKDKFLEKLNEKIELFKTNNIKEIITVCASCTDVFRKYTDFKITPIYNYFSNLQIFNNFNKVHVHDPCSLRFDRELHETIRKIVKNSGKKVEKFNHEKDLTYCCGEGGAAGFIDKTYAKSWKKKRLTEAEFPVVVYCYGCKFFLKNKKTPVFHILDLIFDNKKETGKLKYWWNKWKIKRIVQKKF